MSDWLNIRDKVYVVTGGSSGIGLAIVEGLLEQGAKVANLDIRDSNVSHERLLFVETNVASHQAVKEAVARVVEHFGTIDGLVNNAGINIPSLLVDTKEEAGQYELDEAKFDKMVDINFKGLFFVSQEVARILAAKGSGVIINMASEAESETVEVGVPAVLYSRFLNGVPRVIVAWLASFGLYS